MITSKSATACTAAISHCLTHTSDVICATCADGYIYSNNKCEWKDTLSATLNCGTAGPKAATAAATDATCTDCATGYGLNAGKCYALVANCKDATQTWATSKWTCTACKDGFDKSANGNCIDISAYKAKSAATPATVGYT